MEKMNVSQVREWEDKLDKIFEDNMIGYCSQIGGAEEIQIKELIQKELDKAREEGYQAGYKVGTRDKDNKGILLSKLKQKEIWMTR